jgi:hypothetical protein
MSLYACYIYILWLSAYIYGCVKPPLQQLFGDISKATKITHNYIYKYFNNIENDNIHDNPNLSIFVTDGTRMIPFSFDISTLQKHYLLFYVVINTNNDHNKVIVFNSLDKLIFLYNNLEECVKNKISKFSKYLEVRNSNTNEVEYLDTFTNYTDNSGVFFSDITGYSIKARDIYDFKNNRFILSHGDKLHVTKMDLSSQEYHFEEQILC